MSVSPARAERLRRSVHFVPGANERLLEKSLASAADALILDLEDAVTPDRKDSARETVCGWLQSVGFGSKERIVRMNPIDSPYGVDDLEALLEHPPDAILVPKVSTLEEINGIDDRLKALERRYGHPARGVDLLLVATETPRSALNVASFPANTRVAGMTWGAEDLSAALGGTGNRRSDGSFLDTYRYCRVQTLLASAAGGVQPIDGVFVDFKDAGGLKLECEEASAMGFTGKLTIHPAQIEIVNAAFTPDPTQVAEAEELMQRFEEEQAAGRMAFSFRGQMVDAPHLERARRLLARAQLIEGREPNRISRAPHQS